MKHWVLFDGSGQVCGAGTLACRVETRLDPPERRDESRRGRHECLRHESDPQSYFRLALMGGRPKEQLKADWCSRVGEKALFHRHYKTN